MRAATRSRPASTSTHSYKRAAAQGDPFGTINFSNDTNNPLDSAFGFANAALGIFSSLQPGVEVRRGQYIYNNIEAYVQDNWKVNSRLTLDYGVRFVHQQPQYDELGQASNFLPEEWTSAQAPRALRGGLRQRRVPVHAARTARR